MPQDRPYDVVLWGATGFTGQFVADYLARTYGTNDLDWAIAGRSRDRLASLRDSLAEAAPACEELDILTGDAFDRESLDAITGQTRVVCATVGPYAEFGSGMVAACVDQGTDYCDLSGEVHWIREMIDAHHEAAAEAGVRIVHGCGFDSIPSDLGTLLVQQAAGDRYGTPCARVDAYVRASSFSLSGGTYASMLGMYEAMAANPSIRSVVRSPYSLAPVGHRDGPDDGPQFRPAHDDVIDQWTGPFVMAIVNEKVVRRSNAILGYPWGPDFRYREVTPTGTGISGAARATLLSATSGLFDGAMRVGPIRSLVANYVLPDAGTGPDDAEIVRASFEVRLVGRGDTPDGPFTVEGRVAADSHPGYGATPVMLGESAVCLASGETDSPLDGGVLTPASGIGSPLIDRLREAGMTFTVS